MPTRKATPSVYHLKITLTGIAPPIWRRLQVPSAIKLCCLHSALQISMGWTDCHLHRFEKDGKTWGVPEYDEFDELDWIDEGKTQLATVLKVEGESMTYVYDFGDNWRHNVVLEKILPSEDAPKGPVCVGGQRRRPPEDVGGIHGYQDFLDAIFEPTHEEFKHMVQWAGGPFDAEQFDVTAVNKTLAAMRWPVRHRR